MKFHRSAGRQEPRKTRNVALISCVLLSLIIISLVKAYSSSTNVNSQLPINSDLRIGTRTDDSTAESSQPSEGEKLDKKQAIQMKRPVCYELSKRSDTCEVEGNIRVQGSSSTIFIHPSSSQEQWKIRPYSRKDDSVARSNVKEWSLKPVADQQDFPECSKNHNFPALVFSIGGFTGNFYHDFTDVLIPVFISSYQFHGEVQFLISDSDTKDWWVQKYAMIFKQLSKHEIILVESDQDAIHCFPKLIIGPRFHKDLRVDPSKTPNGYSVLDFKELLRKSLSLDRANVSSSSSNLIGSAGGRGIRRPRLLIISRKKVRLFMNLEGMKNMAMSLGFDVRVGQPDVDTDLAKFARLVNSADVMIGVYGAGLTNMFFLPAGAVVIQVIPLGALEWLARDNYKQPTIEMGLHYMDHIIQEDESTLIEEYPRGHPVLSDPLSVHQQGWEALKSTYLDNQNVRPHLGRLMQTLSEALKLLPRD